MSSRHFAIEAGAGGAVLTDAGSTNGTMVEGATIDGAVALSPGEFVQAGSSVFTIVDIDPYEYAVLGRRPPERVFARQFRTAQAALPDKLEAPRQTDVESAGARSNWWRSLSC